MTKFISSLLSLFFALFSSLGLAGNQPEKWVLDIPVYEGGRISSECYLDGSGILSDWDGPTGKESRMELISYTNADEYGAYCDMLCEKGYEKVYSNVLGGVTANAFRAGDKLYYTYFSENLNEVRIVEDNNTRNFEDFSYSYESDEGVTVYQFDYPYADFGEKKDEEIYSTNGMMYIIKLADNSLIVIDGGSIRQSSDKNIDKCIKLMHKITGTQSGEEINIALWYGTHGHSDHVTFFYKLIGYYHGEINLERVMFNYPSLSLVEHDERIDMYRSRLALLYPEVKYLCPHTGMSFDIANTVIDVLYTQEDAVNARTGKTPVTNANDGSLICRISSAGRRFLVLGDMNIIAQTKVTSIHGKEEFKCDVLQGAHHLYNAVAIIYDYADADYVFCPMSYGRGKWLPGHASARLSYKEDQLLYADDALYIIKMDKNGITVDSDHTDCVPYDDSSMNDIH